MTATDFDRWSDPENLKDEWRFRSALAVRHVTAGATVLDIGCGRMAIEAMLPDGCRYIPVDLVARDARTIVCDLNAGEYPAVDGVTHILMLGVLEYLASPQAFFARLAQAPGRQLILSYITPNDRITPAQRRKAGWINDLSRDAMVALAEQSGFALTSEEWINQNNRLFVFRRDAEGAAGRDVPAPAARRGARHALLSYGTSNLSDEIQSVAARQFLPSVDLLIDRDHLHRLPATAERHKIILNGWHTRHPENWPPSPALDPLMVSLHLSNQMNPANRSGRRPAEALLEGESLAYLRAHAPIGARDTWTMALLREKGIDSYFSGCVTLTLGAGAATARGDYVCAVDLAEPVLKRLRARGRIVVTTHADATPAPFAERVLRAERLLSLYAQARCVVTSRLHAALPCLALGTPVLLVLSAKDPYRFDGLKELMRHCAPEEFPPGDFDVNDPPPNGDAYLAYRHALIRTINAFIDPAAAPDIVPHPFTPNTDIAALIAVEQSLALKEAAAARARRTFRQTFKPGADYSQFSRADFLKDLARVHQGLGDLAEAKRLLEAALAERPGDDTIRRRLDQVLAELSRR